MKFWTNNFGGTKLSGEVSVGVRGGKRLNTTGLDDRESESRHGLGIFLFITATRPALGPTQPLIECVPGALFLGVKRPGCEADHSPPSSAEVWNAWSYTSTPPVRLHGVVLSLGTTLPYIYMLYELLRACAVEWSAVRMKGRDYEMGEMLQKSFQV
jgi:hypothetical protein